MPSVLMLSVGYPLCPPLLPLERAMITATLEFGVYMFRSTRHGHGVDVRRCWVPCND